MASEQLTTAMEWTPQEMLCCQVLQVSRMAPASFLQSLSATLDSISGSSVIHTLSSKQSVTLPAPLVSSARYIPAGIQESTQPAQVCGNFAQNGTGCIQHLQILDIRAMQVRESKATGEEARAALKMLTLY